MVKRRLTRHASLGRRRAAALVTRFGGELRIARLTAGLTQAQLAGKVGVSQSFVSLVERGRRRATLDIACALAAAAGHDLSLRLFPASRLSLRDSGQLGLVDSIARRAHASWHLRLEAPVAPGDRRCADLLLVGPHEVIHIEVERWLVDVQAQLRSAELKRQALAQSLERSVRLVIAVPATRRMRHLVAGLGDGIRRVLPASSATILRAIESGHALGADGILLVPVPPGRSAFRMTSRS